MISILISIKLNHYDLIKSPANTFLKILNSTYLLFSGLKLTNICHILLWQLSSFSGLSQLDWTRCSRMALFICLGSYVVWFTIPDLYWAAWASSPGGSRFPAAREVKPQCMCLFSALPLWCLLMFHWPKEVTWSSPDWRRSREDTDFTFVGEEQQGHAAHRPGFQKE